MVKRSLLCTSFLSAPFLPDLRHVIASHLGVIHVCSKGTSARLCGGQKVASHICHKGKTHLATTQIIIRPAEKHPNAAAYSDAVEFHFEQGHEERVQEQISQQFLPQKDAKSQIFNLWGCLSVWRLPRLFCQAEKGGSFLQGDLEASDMSEWTLEESVFLPDIQIWVMKNEVTVSQRWFLRTSCSCHIYPCHIFLTIDPPGCVAFCFLCVCVCEGEAGTLMNQRLETFNTHVPTKHQTLHLAHIQLVNQMGMPVVEGNKSEENNERRHKMGIFRQSVRAGAFVRSGY